MLVHYWTLPVIDAQLEEVLDKCRKIKAFCQTFLGARFSRPFSRQHERLFEVIDDQSIQKVLFIGHRGFGKTSIFNYAIPMQYIVYHNWPQKATRDDFIVLCSATSTSAITQGENLKKELLGNEKILWTVGNLKSLHWSQEEWDTKTGVRVLPRGVEQQVRGLLYGNVRPRIVIPDDLEKTEAVLSQDQRKKLKDWFFSDVINCIDRSRDDWRILVDGTILHEASLLEDLRSDPTWTVISAPLCDESYKSYWPQFMDDKAVEGLREEYSGQGMLDTFAREYMNQAIAMEDAVFRREYFQYYNDIDFHKIPDTETVIIVDPAKTAKVHSAFSAIVAVGLDYGRNAIYVRDIINERLHPEQIYDAVFDMAERFNSTVIGYEVTGLSEFIKQPFRDEMLRRGKMYELVELKARKGEGDYAAASKGKEGRIAALVQYYRIGAIYHNRSVCRPLEDQLLAFPRSKHWDVMDAFAYIIEMKDLGERDFAPEMSDTSNDDFEKALRKLAKDDNYEYDDFEPVEFAF